MSDRPSRSQLAHLLMRIVGVLDFAPSPELQLEVLEALTAECSHRAGRFHRQAKHATASQVDAYGDLRQLLQQACELAGSQADGYRDAAASLRRALVQRKHLSGSWAGEAPATKG